MGQVVDFYAAAWPNFTPALTVGFAATHHLFRQLVFLHL
jgi:hypothetical protein